MVVSILIGRYVERFMWDDNGIFILQVIVHCEWYLLLQYKEKVYWDNFSGESLNKFIEDSNKITFRSIHWGSKCNETLEWDHPNYHRVQS